MESSCDATENIPSWFDWVWYLVWCNVDAYVSDGTPISFTVCPVSYPDFTLKSRVWLHVENT